MLILRRKTGECIYLEIPPGTEPRTVKIQLALALLGKAWIGIEAPREIEIHRDGAIKSREVK